ncbi:MAG: DUF2809 domain-containing protein [Chitinophagaceae bacterium]|nr:DUF2809 domain-containing protein [Chitinophagaceae bacterium]
MLTFNKSYFFAAIILFIVEVLIALYVNDRIIRPYIGDFLVVILMYCFVRAFLNANAVKVAIGVLIFSYLIEFLQYLNLVGFLGLQKSRVANVVLGNYFEWIDIVAYTLGIIAVIAFEWIRETGGKKRYSA